MTLQRRSADLRAGQRGYFGIRRYLERLVVGRVIAASSPLRMTV